MREFPSSTVVALCLCLAVVRPAQAQTAVPAESLFAYQRSAPLLVTDSTVRAFDDGITLHSLSFESPRGGRIGAYLVLPRGHGPFPAVLFGHWGLGTRTEFIPEALLYARLGAISLLIDWPWTRPPPHHRDEGPLDKPEMDRDVHIQAVVDLRRSVDLLTTRPDVDPLRLGYIGHSYGAQFGAILGAIDRRLRAVVLMAGVADNAALLLETEDPDMVAYRNHWSQEQLTRYIEINTPLDAVGWVGRISPTPLLMQFAQYDRFTEASMRRYADAAGEPKTVLWYPTGHELNDPQAYVDRAAWIAQRLGLPSPTRLLEGILRTPKRQ